MVLRPRPGPYTLPKDAFAIRGGDLVITELEESCEMCMSRHGEYGLSIFAAEVPRPEDLFALDPRIARFGHGHYTTAGNLGDARLELRPTFKAPHWTVILPELSPKALDLFVRTFVGRVENPSPVDVPTGDR